MYFKLNMIWSLKKKKKSRSYLSSRNSATAAVVKIKMTKVISMLLTAERSSKLSFTNKDVQNGKQTAPNQSYVIWGFGHL